MANVKIKIFKKW